MDLMKYDPKEGIMLFSDRDRHLSGFFCLAFGLIYLWMIWENITSDESIILVLEWIILLIIGAVFWLIWGMEKILINPSIIINEKSQNIIFKNDSHINKLKSYKKISFSEIDKIEITYYVYIAPDELGDNLNWDINLITTRGECRNICKTEFCKSAKEITEGILEITKKEVSFKDCLDFLSVDYCKKFAK